MKTSSQTPVSTGQSYKDRVFSRNNSYFLPFLFQQLITLGNSSLEKGWELTECSASSHERKLLPSKAHMELIIAAENPTAFATIATATVMAIAFDSLLGD